jgi:MFS family permease
MGTWYLIGLFVGLGAALGAVAAGIVPRAMVAAVAALVVGVIAAVVVEQWPEAIGAAVGAVAGAFGVAPIVSGALRRGGTRGGLALYIGLGGIFLAALAFIPVVGYLMAIALPLLGLRLRSREPDRHAGLRTLARD